MAATLRLADRYTLQQNYDKIREKVNAKSVIQRLYINKAVTVEERFCEDDTSNEDCARFIVHGLLLKDGTYKDLEEVHKALVITKQQSVRELFPSYENQDGSNEEEDEYEYEKIDPDAEGLVMNAGMAHTGKKIIRKVKGAAKSIISSTNSDNVDGQTERQSEFYQSIGSNDSSFAENGETVEAIDPNLLAESAFSLKTPLKMYKKVKVQVKGVISPNGTDSVDSKVPVNRCGGHERRSILDTFLAYSSKNTDNPHGKGMCVMFAFFTGQLPGYSTDVDKINEYFSQQLHYKVKLYENLTQKEMLKKAAEVQKQIEKDKQYDRLVVIVLTQGTSAGLATSGDKIGKSKEVLSGSKELVHTEISQIVEAFKVPSLKGMPKVFLIQSCRGSSSQEKAPKAADDMLPYQPRIPLDEDVLICYASTLDHPSLLSEESGSWFVQELLDMFQKYEKQQHVADMMPVLHQCLADRADKLPEGNKKSLQKPCTWSTLSKRFYLYHL